MLIWGGFGKDLTTTAPYHQVFLENKKVTQISNVEYEKSLNPTFPNSYNQPFMNSLKKEKKNMFLKTFLKSCCCKKKKHGISGKATSVFIHNHIETTLRSCVNCNKHMQEHETLRKQHDIKHVIKVCFFFLTWKLLPSYCFSSNPFKKQLTCSIRHVNKISHTFFCYWNKKSH